MLPAGFTLHVERLWAQGYLKHRSGGLTLKIKNIVALTRKGLTWLETVNVMAFQQYCNYRFEYIAVIPAVSACAGYNCFFSSWCSSSATQPTYEAEEFTIWEKKSSTAFAPVSLSDDLLPKGNNSDNSLQDAEVRKNHLPKILTEPKDTGEKPCVLFSLRRPESATFWEVLPPVWKQRHQRLDPSPMQQWQLDLHWICCMCLV